MALLVLVLHVLEMAGRRKALGEEEDNEEKKGMVLLLLLYVRHVLKVVPAG